MNGVTRVVGVLGTSLVMLAGVAACEKKEAQQPAATTTKPASEGMKGAADSAGKALSEGAEKAKEAVKETAAKVEEKAKEAAAKVEEKAKEAVAAISEKAKAAMNEYLGGLGDANSAMEKIKSALDVPANLPALNEASKKVNANSTVLGALPDAEKSAVKDANKDQLGSLTAKFKEHMDRLTNGDLGKMVGDAIKSFKLFE